MEPFPRCRSILQVMAWHAMPCPCLVSLFKEEGPSMRLLRQAPPSPSEVPQMEGMETPVNSPAHPHQTSQQQPDGRRPCLPRAATRCHHESTHTDALTAMRSHGSHNACPLFKTWPLLSPAPFPSVTQDSKGSKPTSKSAPPMPLRETEYILGVVSPAYTRWWARKPRACAPDESAPPRLFSTLRRDMFRSVQRPLWQGHTTAQRNDC